MNEKEPEKCPSCDGLGEYCFPEAAWRPDDDGWYKCKECDGTGVKPANQTSSQEEE